ncbi:response regulator, partial [Aduncisulcus paluster]
MTVFSLPIRSRSEIVGSAACLVDFSRSEMVTTFQNSHECRMVLFDQGKAYDLITGDVLPLTMGESSGSKELIKVRIGKSNRVFCIAVNCALKRTFWLLLPLFGVVIGLCIVVSLILSSKLTRPLRIITASAEDISKGQDSDIPDRDSRISEIHALGKALSSMLENLRRTRD